jgi:hypothetical protein
MRTRAGVLNGSALLHPRRSQLCRSPLQWRRGSNRLAMRFLRTIRCLRPSLLAFFVLAQVVGVVPLIYDHTLNVYETVPVSAHAHAHVKPTVTNPDADQSSRRPRST